MEELTSALPMNSRETKRSKDSLNWKACELIKNIAFYHNISQ